MYDLPDHPVIRCIEKTGYAPTQNDDSEFYCPECGEELVFDDEVYIDFNGNIVGCCHCLRRRDMSEVLENE